MRNAYHVGDEVKFMLVDRKVKGMIVEDRGRYGPDRHHIYRVRVEYLYSPSMDYELSEDVLELSMAHAGHR